MAPRFRPRFRPRPPSPWVRRLLVLLVALCCLGNLGLAQETGEAGAPPGPGPPHTLPEEPSGIASGSEAEAPVPVSEGVGGMVRTLSPATPPGDGDDAARGRLAGEEGAEEVRRLPDGGGAPPQQNTVPNLPPDTSREGFPERRPADEPGAPPAAAAAAAAEADVDVGDARDGGIITIDDASAEEDGPSGAALPGAVPSAAASTSSAAAEAPTPVPELSLQACAAETPLVEVLSGVLALGGESALTVPPGQLPPRVSEELGRASFCCCHPESIVGEPVSTAF